MSVDINSMMMVGCQFNEFDIKDQSLEDFSEETNLRVFQSYYDAPESQCYVGFIVDDIDVKDIGLDWLDKVKDLAQEFYELTGVPARLMSVLDIT